jgi:pimeloyl-ACP methyl ester carboxylesterase
MIIIAVGLVIDTRTRGQGSQGTKGKVEEKSMWSVSNPDPSLFRWNGPVGPGKTACGYLTVPISYSAENLEQPFPFAARAKQGLPLTEVFFCMKFAAQFPAKGNMFIHCGGPSSISGCVQTNSAGHSIRVQREYNFFAVDQRGMGKTAWIRSDAEARGVTTGLDFALCAGLLETATAFNLPNQKAMLLNPDLPQNKQRLQDGFSVIADNKRACWSKQAFDIKNPNIRENAGTYGPLHFLRNSGTQALVNDINLFRHAIGAAKISLHGISYGTVVAGAFATTFPQYVDKLILNSPMLPTQDARAHAYEKANGWQVVVDYQLHLCEEAPDCNTTTDEALAIHHMATKYPVLPYYTVAELELAFGKRVAEPGCDPACKADFSSFKKPSAMSTEDFLAQLKSVAMSAKASTEDCLQQNDEAGCSGELKHFKRMSNVYVSRYLAEEGMFETQDLGDFKFFPPYTRALAAFFLQPVPYHRVRRCMREGNGIQEGGEVCRMAETRSCFWPLRRRLCFRLRFQPQKRKKNAAAASCR